MINLHDRLQEWMNANEDEHLEFKEAKANYDSSKLAQYCCALANEGGGRILFGVTDKRPRKIAGSQAFPQPECTRATLLDKLRINVTFEVINHPEGRVLVFHVPSHPIGLPVQVDGRFWMRQGDSLVPMSAEKLKAIFDEAGHDFSAEVCREASLADLDPGAIADFRKRWIAKSGNQALELLSDEQLLFDAEALTDDGVTYAVLVLFGTRAALGNHLAQAETIFEYHSANASGPAQQRKEYRQGFFAYYDDLWNTINLRNDRQHYQEGLFVWDIPTFDERTIREAILNAISHRDYRAGGSVFIRQWPDRLVVESPGGFPAGITKANVLDRQNPRNRRIAEILAKCGLVERSGQGMNLMFENAIRQGKLPPDFTGTDSYLVRLTLCGLVNDTAFVGFLEQIGKENALSISTHDFLVLDLVHRGLSVPEPLQPRIRGLLENGILESVGRGRGLRYLLSKRFYKFIGKEGVYTRERGLDRETNKALLLKHITDNATAGSKMAELRQVLPGHSRPQIQVLLRELVKEQKVHVHGLTRAARWYPGLEGPDCNHQWV